MNKFLRFTDTTFTDRKVYFYVDICMTEDFLYESDRYSKED